MGRQTRITFADETFIASAYDVRGNKTAEYGNASYSAVFEFDIYNQRIGQEIFRTLAETPEVLANLTDGDETAWTFDGATGLLLSKIYPNESSVHYTYTPTGLLASRAWARGVTTAYAYDEWKQLIAVNYSDATADVVHVYDAFGREISRTDAAGTMTFAYNDFGDKISEIVSSLGNKTITYHFDNFSRDIGYSIDGVRKTTLSYDAANGKLVSVNAGGRNWAWLYFAGTHLTQQVVAPNALTTDYVYEVDRDLLARYHCSSYIKKVNRIIF